MNKAPIRFSPSSVILLVLVIFCLSACSTEGDNTPAVSRALPDNKDGLVSNRRAHHFQATEFRTAFVTPLHDGAKALHTRLETIGQAHGSIDVSLFILREDDAGILFVSRVLNAADRGVKVRLLLDDLFNRRTAKKFYAIDNHPNIEIRIFNPFSRLSPTSVSFMIDYEKSRRRMHSRLQIVDGAHAIIGGRNVADEYFTDNGSSRFLDFEIAMEGKGVRAISHAFELYWNDQWSVPVAAVQTIPDTDDLKKLRQNIAQRAEPAIQGKYQAVFKADKRTSQGQSKLRVATSFVSDEPAKLRNRKPGGPFFVSQSHFNDIAQARKSVLIVTPYFIPTEAGARMLERLSSMGIQVEIVTNSLASTNHVAVHGGYIEYRERLLRSGVKIYELKARSNIAETQRDMVRTLHSKFTVVDGQKTIVTTMNFDPISLTGNLESSVIVRDRTFARWMLQHANPIADGICYKLELDAYGALSWHEMSGSTSKISRLEPEATLGNQLLFGLVNILDLEKML